MNLASPNLRKTYLHSRYLRFKQQFIDKIYQVARNPAHPFRIHLSLVHEASRR
jgi:hypothetical protein